MPTNSTPPGSGASSRGWAKAIIFLVILAGLFTLFRFVDVASAARSTLDWIDAQGVWAPILFILLYIVATVLFVPGTILTLGAGVLFGVGWGSAYVSIGSTLGAGLAFLIGRYGMRKTVTRWLEGRDSFRAIDAAVAGEGWKIVGLTRLSPVFPFNLLNYAFGLTKVRFLSYFLASWIGMLPGTILYVYLGSAAGSLASLGGGGGERTTGETVFFFLGLAATLGVTIYVTKVARGALKSRIAASPENEEIKQAAATGESSGEA